MYRPRDVACTGARLNYRCSTLLLQLMCQPIADSRVCWVKYGSWCQGGAEDHGRFWRCASAPSGALGQCEDRHGCCAQGRQYQGRRGAWQDNGTCLKCIIMGMTGPLLCFQGCHRRYLVGTPRRVRQPDLQHRRRWQSRLEAPGPHI